MQVITVPDGWPIWTSQVRPRARHRRTLILLSRTSWLIRAPSSNQRRTRTAWVRQPSTGLWALVTRRCRSAFSRRARYHDLLAYGQLSGVCATHVAQGSYEVDLGRNLPHIPESSVFSLHLNGFSVSPVPTARITLCYLDLTRKGSVG